MFSCSFAIFVLYFEASIRSQVFSGVFGWMLLIWLGRWCCDWWWRWGGFEGGFGGGLGGACWTSSVALPISCPGSPELDFLWNCDPGYDFTNMSRLSRLFRLFLWQNRFYSCRLAKTHLWRALLYVDLNPVRAGLVNDPTAYPRSSAAAHKRQNRDSLKIQP